MDPLDVRRNRPATSNVREPLRESASQTAGPYVHIGCLPNAAGITGVFPADLTDNGAADGPHLRLVGHVYDGDGVTCNDMLVETWQVDASGDARNGLWRRTATDRDTGQYIIDTVRPGGGRDPDGTALAPFISVWLAARGIGLGLLTRAYLADETALNDADPHLARVPPGRRGTLLARPTGAAGEYGFDIHLQGAAETVFLDV